jgi:hypothetical protein
MSDPNIDNLEAEIENLRANVTQGISLGNWWTWTITEFENWCSERLMTDAQIDATTLGLALKTNIKANNAFVRNAGKVLIVARDTIKWLIRKLI